MANKITEKKPDLFLYPKYSIGKKMLYNNSN